MGTATAQRTVEVRITSTSIAGIDPETQEAWAYSNLDRDNKVDPDTRVQCRADRAQELIAAGAAELTDSDDNPSPAELDQLAVKERDAMRKRIRLAELEKRKREDDERDDEGRERATDDRAGRRSRR